MLDTPLYTALATTTVEWFAAETQEWMRYPQPPTNFGTSPSTFSTSSITDSKSQSKPSFTGGIFKCCRIIHMVQCTCGIFIL